MNISKEPYTIKIEGLAYRWPGQGEDLLEIPILQVPPGEKLFLMGTSGSGKSTLLSLLGGVIQPVRGLISILGKDLKGMKPAERDAFRAAHMGFIFQQFNLVPYLSVIDNVTLPCRFSGKKHGEIIQKGSTPGSEAWRLLDYLGIAGKELLGKPVSELSVGQQQRVAAARALMGSPKLLICDEPTSSLDAGVQEAFIRLLFEECERQQSTLVFVSHDERFGSLFDRSLHLRKAPEHETHTLEEGGAS